MEPTFSLPPLGFWRGVDPSPAEKSRPDLKTFGSGTLATIAEAASFPIPVISADRVLGMNGGDLLVEGGDGSVDRFQMLGENLQSRLGSSGSVASLSAFAISSSTRPIPLAAMPNSER
jgi:hypothetical protein